MTYALCRTNCHPLSHGLSHRHPFIPIAEGCKEILRGGVSMQGAIEAVEMDKLLAVFE